MTDDRKCAYRNCENTYTDEVPFYFPTTDIRRRRIWLKNAGNDSLYTLRFKALKFRFICAKHFPVEYIRRSTRISLVKHAVPVHYITGDIEPGDDPYKMPQDESTTEIENMKYRKASIKPSNKCKALVKKAPKRAAENQKETQKKYCEPEGENTMTTLCFSYATRILPPMSKINAFAPIVPEKELAVDQNDLEETQKENYDPIEQENTINTSFISYATRILEMLPPWLKGPAMSDMSKILIKCKKETKGLKTQEDSADRLIDLSLLPNESKVSQLEGSNDSNIRPQIKPELEEPMIKTEPGLSNEPETELK